MANIWLVHTLLLFVNILLQKKIRDIEHVIIQFRGDFLLWMQPIVLSPG